MLARPVHERAIQRGELDPSLDPELVTDLIYGPRFYRVIRGRAVDLARAEQFVRATLPNLAPA